MHFTLNIAAIAGALTLALGSALANEATAPVDPDTITGSAPLLSTPASKDHPLFTNPLDPSTWFAGGTGMDHAEMAMPEDFNMAHPKFWTSFFDPETHFGRHMQVTNPATYAEFMDPGFYMQFANPANWMAWFDPANYETLARKETYTYWMNPGSYVHGLEPRIYMQMLNPESYEPFMKPATYMQFMDPEAYDLSELGEGTKEALSALNPFSILSMANLLYGAN